MFYMAPEGRAKADKWKHEQISVQIEENVSSWQNCDLGGLTSAEAKFGRDPGPLRQAPKPVCSNIDCLRSDG